MTDIFEGTPPPQDPPQQVAPPVLAVPDTLKELVGDGKKYATVDAALASIGPAQAHIAKLEAEAAELREKAASASSVDDVRQAVEAILEARGAPAAPSLDPNAVASVVDGLLSKREQEAAATANQKSVTDALTAAYGDKASEKFGEAAAALGMTRQQLSDMARTAPAAALRLFDLKPKGSQPLRSDLNTENFRHQPTPQKVDIMRGAPTGAVVDAWRRAHPDNK